MGGFPKPNVSKAKDKAMKNFTAVPKREYRHPKEVLRAIHRHLPEFSPRLNVALCAAVVTALYAQSQGFHEKEDLDRGYIRFSGTISYGQIAEFVRCGYSTAKHHCVRLRELGLLTWTVGPRWIEFTVCIAVAQGEFLPTDIGNKFRSSRPLRTYRMQDGKFQKMNTIRYVDGRCPDCDWDEGERTGWCIDCYEEMKGEGDGEVAVDWGLGECLECGDDCPCGTYRK
jgi:hypothetical protein